MENVTMEFTDGVNVLVGDNSFGKSIFMKVLDYTISPDKYDSKDRVNLIRRGKLYASAHYWFSDGVDCIVEIHPNKTLYRIRDINVDVEYISDIKPFDGFINRLSILYDLESGMLINAFDASKEYFLVSSDARANERLLRASCYNESLSLLKEYCSEKYDEYKDKYSKAYFVCDTIENKMNTLEYTDIESLRFLYNLGNMLLRFLDSSISLNEYLNSLTIVTNLEGLSYQEAINLTRLGDLQNALNSLSSFNKTTVLMFYSLEKILSFLEESGKVIPLKKWDYALIMKYIDLLELVDGLQFITDVSVLLEIVDFKVKLNALVNVISDFANSKNIIKDSQVQIDKINSNLHSVKGFVNCPIYGEVLHENGKCIPINK